MVIEWIVANKELFKVIYALIILFVCSFITIKADRLFKISDYQGIRYFRNAFFFFGLSIVARFILGPVQTTFPFIFGELTKLFFQFSVLVGTLFLVYSLIWKKIESQKKHHSLFNLNALIFYLIALIVVGLESIFNNFLLFYIFEICFLLIILIISLKNSLENKKRSSFLKTYVIAIFIWIIAFLIESLKPIIGNSGNVLISIYILNGIFFLLFLGGVRRLSNGKEKR